MTTPAPSLFFVNDLFVCIVYQCLGFYSHLGLVFDVELTELNGPLHHLSCGFRFIHHLLDELVHHHYDRVRLKVWTKLLGGNNKGKCDLLHARVFGFSPLESLANIIHRVLYSLLFLDKCRSHSSCRYCQV